MEQSRTDAQHAARRDEHCAHAVLLHQHCFTCDPAVCTSSLAALLHLLHLVTRLLALLHLRPAVLHFLCHPPSCTSYRPSCNCPSCQCSCSTCGPPTNACCTCTALALSCTCTCSTAAPAARRCPVQPRCAHASSSLSRARLRSSPTSLSLSAAACCTPRMMAGLMFVFEPSLVFYMFYAVPSAFCLPAAPAPAAQEGS